jgi:hypothetical protein
VTDPSTGKIVSGELFAAAERLRIDAATAEILRAFASNGVDALVLKGPSLTSWLYPPGRGRSYLDSDLLVRPGHESGAEHALEAAGFARRWDESALPDWWQEHGSDWLRAEDGVRVDLHRTLPGLGAEPHVVWAALAAGAVTIPVGGRDAPTLSLPGRALHVALHAVQHGEAWGKGRGDLERALAIADEATWQGAVELATELGGRDALAAGLRVIPEGADLADRLGLPTGLTVDLALRASAPPPVALGFEQLAQAPGMRERLSIGLHKLFPPREFLEHWDPRAGESRGRLALARVRRPFWVLASAPRGLRAWLQARRRARG